MVRHTSGTYSILQWFVGVGNRFPGGVTIAVVVGTERCMILLRPRDVVVPTCRASVEHLANIDRLVSMVFEVLQSVRQPL